MSESEPSANYTDTTDRKRIEWPAPRDDPDREPHEPWARPNGWTAEDWQRLREAIHDAAEAHRDPKS